MSLLQVSGIGKYNGKAAVLHNIHFTQQRSQKIAIAGETGSGKTTLMKIIAGLIQPDEGQVLLSGERVLGPDEKLLPGHPAIAYLSQHFELRNNYRVEELLEMASKLPEAEAYTIYEVCRITHLLKRRTDQLSGGERQRISIARLLTTSPQLLLLDEPFSNLDAIHKQLLKGVIHDIGEQLKLTCMLIAHDPLDLLSWADQVMVMKNGQIIQQGSPREVYSRPVDAYAAALFGTYTRLPLHRAQTLFPLNGHAVDAEHLFLRPEHFQLATGPQSGAEGTVTRTQFFGSYYELTVRIAETEITLKSLEGGYQKGDLVFVSLLPERFYN